MTQCNFTAILHKGAILAVATLAVACNSTAAQPMHGSASDQAQAHGDDKGHGHMSAWSYKGQTGPEFWGEIKPEYATCKSGHNQSPIDLTAALATELPSLQFNYQPTELDVMNNGHTLQIGHGNGSSVVIDGKSYELVQFHFHSPSEHNVDGKSHAMEAHLVHQSEDGQLAVLGILMDIGEKNPFIDTLWGIEANHGERVTVSHVTINVADLLPQDKSYFKYSGSLTTPPCTEGVLWIVFKSMAEVSAEQVKRFKDIFELSARPVQDLHSRSILATQ